MSNYTLVHNFSAVDLFTLGACGDELDRFVDRYGRTSYINQDNFNGFVEYAKGRPGWINFLFDKGLIRKIADEITYKVGDRFKIDRGYGDVRSYILASATINDQSMAALINLKTGEPLRKFGTYVATKSAVTKAEMTKLAKKFPYRKVS